MHSNEVLIAIALAGGDGEYTPSNEQAIELVTMLIEKRDVEAEQ